MALEVGEILFDPNFVFPDGHSKGKYFVILGRSMAGDYVVVRTTSNPQRKSFDYGCHNDEPDPSFAIPKSVGVFPKDTWICLDYALNLDELLFEQQVKACEISKFGVMPKEVLRNLMDCASRADDIDGRQVRAIRDALAGIS